MLYTVHVKILLKQQLRHLDGSENFKSDLAQFWRRLLDFFLNSKLPN